MINTAAKFEVRLRSAGDYQAGLAALDELQAKLEYFQSKSRVILELLDLPGMLHNVSMQELAEAIDRIQKEIIASGDLDQKQTQLTRTTGKEDCGPRQMSNREGTQRGTQERATHAPSMELECRRLPGTSWSTAGRGTDADPLKPRLQAGTANTMEMKPPRNIHSYIGLLKEKKQANNADQRQGNNDKERWRLRPEKKEILEAHIRQRERPHQQPQGECCLSTPRRGNGSDDKIDERSGPQHEWNPSNRTEEISSRHDDAHSLDRKGGHGGG